MSEEIRRDPWHEATLRERDALRAELARLTAWTYTADKMPERDGYYLVCLAKSNGDDAVTVDYWRAASRDWSYLGDCGNADVIYAWRELPEAAGTRST